MIKKNVMKILSSYHPVSMGHLYVLTRLATPHVGEKTQRKPHVCFTKEKENPT